MTTLSREDLEDFLTPDYVDLSLLPAPKVIEELDYETIFQEMLTYFQGKNPDYNALLESDPVIIALQSCAYREMLLRSRINEAAKANMLAYAEAEDLDNLSATLYYNERLVIDEGDPNATPPIPPTYESDDRLRIRTQLAMESFTTAGSEKAYLYHTLSASTGVKSVGVDSPQAGQVLITILSNVENGVASEELINEVKSYLDTEDKRPLTDQVIVQSAEIVNYSINAKVHLYPGPSVPIVEAEINTSIQEYTAKNHKIGGVVALSGIYDALHTEGVKKVELIAPTQDITTSEIQAGYCENINLEIITDE